MNGFKNGAKVKNTYSTLFPRLTPHTSKNIHKQNNRLYRFKENFMKKPHWLAFLPLMAFFAFPLSGCLPRNRIPLYQRSMIITNKTVEEEVLSRASLREVSDPAFGNLKILHLRGTPEEMGFQHGRLLRKDIQKLYNRILRLAKVFASEDMMDEAFDLMAPYIPLEEMEEMRGLAHGADLPLRMVHWLHIVPEISEYGPKKRFRKGFKATSCSNLIAFGKATRDGEMYQLRVLDWIRELGAQEWPVIIIHEPNQGNASVSFSYAGFIGAISGMNNKQMAFGEMGYGNPPGESLNGIPFPFLFRKLMREADTLAQAEEIIKNAVRTCSYVYLISDAKVKDPAEGSLLFITDRGRVKISRENTLLVDERPGKKKDLKYLPIDDVVYGGAKSDDLYKSILKHYGNIDENSLQEIAKDAALRSNMQNVIFKPRTLEAWVSNAGLGKGDEDKASNREWFYFNLQEELETAPIRR